MPALTRAARFGAMLGAALALFAGAAGCKKKASPQECDALIDRYAELVVKEQFPDAGPEVIAKERAREHSEAKGDDAFKNCTSEVQADELTCAMKATNPPGMIKCLE